MAVVASVKRFWIGNTEGGLFRSRPSVSRLIQLNAAKELVVLQGSLSAKGARSVSGFEGTLSRGRTIAHFENRL